VLDILKNILQFIADVVGFVIDLIQWAVVKVFLMFAEALIGLLSLIPVPEWLSSLSGNVAALPAGVLFFVGPLQLTTGCAWIVSAYVLRFLIRRIPVIG